MSSSSYSTCPLSIRPCVILAVTHVSFPFLSTCRVPIGPCVTFELMHVAFYGCSTCRFLVVPCVIFIQVHVVLLSQNHLVTELFTGLVLASTSLIFIIPFQPSQLFQHIQPNGLHSVTEEMMRQEITESEPHKLQQYIVHHTTTDNRYIIHHNKTDSSSHHQNSSEPTSTGVNDRIRAEKRYQQCSPARFSEGRDCSLPVTSSCPHTVVRSSAALPLPLPSSS